MKFTSIVETVDVPFFDIMSINVYTINFINRINILYVGFKTRDQWFPIVKVKLVHGIRLHFSIDLERNEPIVYMILLFKITYSMRRKNLFIILLKL